MNQIQHHPDFTYDSIMRCSEEDKRTYAKWVSVLPAPQLPNVPYGCGPHSIRAFKSVCAMLNPKTVLEIGFNVGCSATFWINLGVKRLVSVDIRDDEDVRQAGLAMMGFGVSRNSAFELVIGTAPNVQLPDLDYDLIFIDGGHLYQDVMNDIALGRKHGIKNFFFDDIFHEFGPGVAPAILDSGLIPVATFGNMCLCVDEPEWKR